MWGGQIDTCMFGHERSNSVHLPESHAAHALIILNIVQLLSVCAVGLQCRWDWALIGRAGGFILGVGRAVIED